MKQKRTFSQNSINLLFLSVFLVCGIILGSVTASYVSDSTASRLFDSVSEMAMARTGFTFTIQETIISVFKYPILAFLLGYTALGVVLLPVALSIKGFFTSFSITVIISLFGISGIWLSVAIFSIQTMILIPCILMISSQSFESAKAQAKFLRGARHSGIGMVFSKKHFLIFTASLIILMCLVLIELFITPRLVSMAFNTFFE